MDQTVTWLWWKPQWRDFFGLKRSSAVCRLNFKLQWDGKGTFVCSMTFNDFGQVHDSFTQRFDLNFTMLTWLALYSTLCNSNENCDNSNVRIAKVINSCEVALHSCQTYLPDSNSKYSASPRSDAHRLIPLSDEKLRHYHWRQCHQTFIVQVFWTKSNLESSDSTWASLEMQDPLLQSVGTAVWVQMHCEHRRRQSATGNKSAMSTHSTCSCCSTCFLLVHSIQKHRILSVLEAKNTKTFPIPLKEVPRYRNLNLPESNSFMPAGGQIGFESNIENQNYWAFTRLSLTWSLRSSRQG